MLIAEETAITSLPQGTSEHKPRSTHVRYHDGHFVLLGADTVKLNYCFHDLSKSLKCWRAWSQLAVTAPLAASEMKSRELPHNKAQPSLAHRATTSFLRRGAATSFATAMEPKEPKDSKEPLAPCDTLALARNSVYASRTAASQV